MSLKDPIQSTDGHTYCVRKTVCKPFPGPWVALFKQGEEWLTVRAYETRKQALAAVNSGQVLLDLFGRQSVHDGRPVADIDSGTQCPCVHGFCRDSGPHGLRLPGVRMPRVAVVGGSPDQDDPTDDVNYVGHKIHY